MNPPVYVLSLGCPRNLVDSEALRGLLKDKGFKLTDSAKLAGVIIINTCAFIESAKQESIDAILEAARAKKDSLKRPKKLIVTGCLSQRYPRELKEEIPEIDGVFGSSDFPKIPAFIKKTSAKNNTFVSRKPAYLYNDKIKRNFITPNHYAYVKIQEGCMNNCSYCIIPRLKGPYRSRDINSIIREAELLIDSGVSEINLVGQDTTLYGVDRYGRPRLAELLGKLSGVMKKGWVRLLYTHPAHYNDEIISAIAESKSVCRYVDLPIQHINDSILEKMNRKTSKQDITRLIEVLRKRIPGVAIRSTVMVGFPGETDKDFKELADFIKDVKFERLGAFIYSAEEDTKAFAFRGHVPEKIKNERYDEILKIQQRISVAKNKSFVGKIFNVIIDPFEGQPRTSESFDCAQDSSPAQSRDEARRGVDERASKGHTHFLGRTEMDAPEVDGTCYVKSGKKLNIGGFYNVRITDTMEYDLIGEVA